MTNRELTEFNKKRKICQISVITRDVEKTMKKWVEYLGIGPWNVYSFDENTVKNLKVHGKSVTEPFKFIVALTNVGDMQFEIIQPVYGPTIYEKFLKEKGEGLYHIKEKIGNDEIDSSIKQYEAKGIGIAQTGWFGADVHIVLDSEPFLDFIYELGNSPVIDVPAEMYYTYPRE